MNNIEMLKLELLEQLEKDLGCSVFELFETLNNLKYPLNKIILTYKNKEFIIEKRK